MIGDVAAFVGGIRALLIQTAHPEVVAGVEQHSKYRTGLADGAEQARAGDR